MPASTSWARESARLAFFAVAMSERRDDALLGLFEQANNALESYLKVTETKPPRLGSAAGPPPNLPLPAVPQRTSSRRPLSILAPGPLPNRMPPEPKSAWSEPSSAVTQGSSACDTEVPLSQEARRQYCLAFLAVDDQLPRSDYRRYMLWLALYDVCLGKSVDVAARTRQVPVSDLRDAMLSLTAIGPKAFLDQALSLRLPPGHAL